LFYSTQRATVIAYLLLILNVAFEINEDTKEWLKNLEAPLGVISVAGMYRTGKSYLLNRMLLNQSRGFDVGPTINACTKVSQSTKSSMTLPPYLNRLPSAELAT
jgi:hypothetical protein